MDDRQRILMFLASILVLGSGTQWLAWRIRVPAILLLLVVGFLAGPVTGFVDPEAIFGKLLLPIVSLSVGLILFEGGLNLRFQDLRYTWRSLLGLLTVGVLLTWVGATAAAVWLLGLDFPVALVLGAFLDTELDNGAVIKTTKLTESFDFPAFQKHYANRAWPLFVIEGKRLLVLATDVKAAPRPGQAVISLVRPEIPREQTAANA